MRTRAGRWNLPARNVLHTACGAQALVSVPYASCPSAPPFIYLHRCSQLARCARRHCSLTISRAGGRNAATSAARAVGNLLPSFLPSSSRGILHPQGASSRRLLTALQEHNNNNGRPPPLDGESLICRPHTGKDETENPPVGPAFRGGGLVGWNHGRSRPSMYISTRLDSNCARTPRRKERRGRKGTERKGTEGSGEREGEKRSGDGETDRRKRISPQGSGPCRPPATTYLSHIYLSYYVGPVWIGSLFSSSFRAKFGSPPGHRILFGFSFRKTLR